MSAAGSDRLEWSLEPAGPDPGAPERGRWRALSRAGLALFGRDVDRDGDPFTAFYAPGCLCVVPRAGAEAFAAGVMAGEAVEGWPARLRAAAASAPARARRLGEEPFRPECLTLYLNQACNLRCTYCFADSAAPPSVAPHSAARLDLPSIVAAARLVAANCRDRDLPFYVGLHGGGEPLLDPDWAETVFRLLDSVARENDVRPFYYVATNGVLPEAAAQWLAGRVHRVGLSCDGPPAVHNAQRPTRTGQPSLEMVARTARVLRVAGLPFHARATITRRAVGRLPEIVDDLCRRLAPGQIHLEPVYSGGRSSADQALTPAEAGLYVAGYLAACDVAASYGVELITSGSRLETIHGPYCHLFRQVLNLVPGGVATACFKTATAAEARRQGVVMGVHDPARDCFDLHGEQVAALRARLAVPAARCRTCLNSYHCAGDCPDTCRLDPTASETSEPGFRCVMLYTLTTTLLDRRAAELWRQVSAGDASIPHGTHFS